MYTHEIRDVLWPGKKLQDNLAATIHVLFDQSMRNAHVFGDTEFWSHPRLDW